MTYECQNCGYEGSVMSGPCPGCKLSMPQRKLKDPDVEEPKPGPDGKINAWLGPVHLDQLWSNLPFFAAKGFPGVEFTKETSGRVLGEVLGYLRRLQRFECSRFVGDALLGGAEFSDDRGKGRLRRIGEIMFCRGEITQIKVEAGESKYDEVCDLVARANAALRLGNPGRFMQARIEELTRAASPPASARRAGEWKAAASKLELNGDDSTKPVTFAEMNRRLDQRNANQFTLRDASAGLIAGHVKSVVTGPIEGGVKRMADMEWEDVMSKLAPEAGSLECISDPVLIRRAIDYTIAQARAAQEEELAVARWKELMKMWQWSGGESVAKKKEG